MFVYIAIGIFEGVALSLMGWTSFNIGLNKEKHWVCPDMKIHGFDQGRQIK